jgi:hypothetical protein
VKPIEHWQIPKRQELCGCGWNNRDIRRAEKDETIAKRKIVPLEKEGKVPSKDEFEDLLNDEYLPEDLKEEEFFKEVSLPPHLIGRSPIIFELPRTDPSADLADPETFDRRERKREDFPLKDYAVAHMWFNLSAFNADKEYLKKEAVRERLELEDKMTPQQIEKANEMARNWKPKK